MSYLLELALTELFIETSRLLFQRSSRIRHMSRENIHGALMKLLQAGVQALFNSLRCQSALEVTADGNSSVNHP